MTRANATRIAVLGDGGWGTTLAIHLHRRGHAVRWWGAFPDYLKTLARRRENVTYLPGIPIPKSLTITPDLSDALAGARIVVLAVPSQHLRSVVRRIRPSPGAVFVNAAKGLEIARLQRMSEVIAEELGRVPVAVLSGPNLATEVAKGDPASAVIACRDRTTATALQHAFMSERMRVYTSDDVIGVELAGALKNPVAIAAGIADGLGFGANTKAALVARGVVEMARLGAAMGARRETFWGLSGLGDLLTTCLGGRNRGLGEQIGRGKRPVEALRASPMVIEGVPTSKAAVALAKRHRVELPIIEQVVAVLFHRKSPRSAVQALMSRSPKSETG